MRFTFNRQFLVVSFAAVAFATQTFGAIPLPPLQPGPARPWQAEVAVSTYSSVNTFTGNLFTEIPLFSWSGRGPDMDFRLFHNSANWNHTYENSKNLGFFLGPGWSTSYSDHIIPSPMTVVHADGTRDVYTWNGTSWIPPSGVFDILTQVDPEDPYLWRLTRKDQSYLEFQGGWLDTDLMRLTKIRDAVGNETTLEYESFNALPDPSGRFRLKRIHAAGRHIELIYEPIAVEPRTRLTNVKDPGDLNEDVSIADRYWTFAYGAVGDPGHPTDWFTSIKDPLTPNENIIRFSYHSRCLFQGEGGCETWQNEGRLVTISNKYRPDDSNPAFSTPKDYTFIYNELSYGRHRLIRVCDPGCSNCTPSGLCSQRFNYSAQHPGYIITRYYDRRGSQWKYQYNDSTQNIYYANPYVDGNLNQTFDPLGASNYYFYSSARQPLDIIDSAGRYFNRSYDSRGNLLSQTDGENNTRSWAYDSLDNLTRYTTPLGSVTRYCYEKPGYPTLLTKIIEPDDSLSPSSPVDCDATGYPTTTMDYYIGDPNSGSHGLLMEVVDPNGVWTGFEYDQWGQQRRYTEGRWNTQVAGTQSGCVVGSLSNGGGFINESSGPGDSGGECDTDEIGNSTGCTCLPLFLATAPTERFVPSGFPKPPCAVPDLPRMCAKFGTANGGTAPQYYPEGQVNEIQLKIVPDGCGGTASTRIIQGEFDSLQRQTDARITTDESGGSVERTFDFNPNWGTGTFTRTGPDGVESVTQFDTANRVSTFRRGPAESPIMTAAYAYHPYSSLLDTITYGNGIVQSFQTDGAGRVTQIKYANGETVILRLDYAYTADDLPATITESGTLSGSAIVSYTYDARRRLTQEIRTVTNPYNYAYEYDAGGNRTKKTERNTSGQVIKRTKYYYDRTSTQHGVALESATFQSNYNRLQYYEVFNVDPNTQVESLDTKTWYYYTREGFNETFADIGSATWIVKHEAGTNNYTATRFGYAMNDRTLTYSVGESWTWDGNPENCPANYSIAWAREFRYDGARARYLNRRLDPVALMAGNFVSLEDVWTDYDGDSAYGDYSVTPGTPATVTNLRSYEPGMAMADPWMSTGGTATDYFITDHLGTTRGMALPDGFPDQGATFTAFGEKIAGTDHRYGYVGAHGYQAHSDMPFLHLGARYYDPASGRFVQRDPIGIAGGLNSYAYVLGIPTVFVDPLGLYGISAAHPVGVGAIAEVELVLGAGAAAVGAGTVTAGAIIVGRVTMDAAERLRNNYRDRIKQLEEFQRRQRDRLEDFTDPASADRLRRLLEEAEEAIRGYERMIDELDSGCG